MRLCCAPHQLPLHTEADRTTAESIKAHSLSSWLLVPAAFAFVAVAGVYAFTIVFSTFTFFDDEGFVMISVQGYLTGHPLYDSVFTIYGPFYYFYEWIIHTLTTLPVSHNVTGALCVLHWVTAAAVLAVAGGYITRSVLVGFFIFMQVTVHLTTLSREPGHPQELVVLLLALALLVAVCGRDRRWTMALLGGIGAALLLTKINIGAFYGFALFLVLLCQSSCFQSRRGWYWALLGLAGLLPFVLMRAQLADTLTRDYACRACATMIGVGAVAHSFAGQSRLNLGHWIRAGAGFALTSAGALAVLLLTGSSLSATVHSLVGIPSSFLGGYCYPLRVSNSVWSAVAALLLAATAVILRTRLDRFTRTVSAFKGIYGVLGTLLFVQSGKDQLGFLLPWIWLALLPAKARDSESSKPFARIFLCIMAAWQGLQAFPVAGTQVAVATFLPVLVFSLCLHDAIEVFAGASFLKPHLSVIPSRTAGLLRAMVLLSLLYVFTIHWCSPLLRWRCYTWASPLKLRGASFLRLPAEQAEEYRALTHYLQTECDTFFTVPGFNSLHFWTGKPPPTYFNVFEAVGLNEGQQTDVVNALRRAKRPVIVVNEQRLSGHTDSVVMGGGPLAQFVFSGCLEVAKVSGCRILVPKQAAELWALYTQDGDPFGNRDAVVKNSEVSRP